VISIVCYDNDNDNFLCCPVHFVITINELCHDKWNNYYYDNRSQVGENTVKTVNYVSKDNSNATCDIYCDNSNE
jgi:hypothetical protein